MHNQTKLKMIIAGLLCLSLFCSGPAWPLRVYASVEEYDDEAGDLEGDGPEDDDDVDDDLDEPEPQQAATADNSAELQKIQNQINEANNNLERIKEDQKKIQAQLDSTKNEKEKAEQVRNNYGYQIALTEEEISTLQGRINALQQKVVLLEQEIEQKEKEIVNKQEEIDYSYGLLKKRLRAKYMEDDGTLLGLLLGADSFADFLTRTEYMTRIAQHDRDIMENLTTERIAIEEVKASLESDIEELESDKVQVDNDKKVFEGKKQELSVQYNQAASQVLDIERMEREYNADLAKNKAMQDKMKAEMDNLFKQMEFIKSPYVGGEMAWPLPGYSQVSSRFGSRFGGSDYHTGIDLTGTGCMGATIVAANDGTVSKVNLSHTPGVGYGIFVIIDHGEKQDGSNISTLYAHCSAITVSEGQEVKKGDTIAKVGSTGWSTGAHLHFEVRINGSAVNPASYIGA